MQAQTVKKLHQWHVWSGLISGVNILILSVTGSILVFVHELHHAIGPELPLHIETERPADFAALPLEPLVSRISAEHPTARPALLSIPAVADHVEDPDHFIYFFELHPAAGAGSDPADHGEHIEYFFDPESGRFAPESDAVDIPAWIWHLHADLFLGFVGQIVLGVFAVAFLISTVTGLMIYAPFMKGLAFGALRAGGLRLLLADAHKLVGVGTLAFNLLMATTGILLTLGQFLINLYSYSIISTLDPVAPAPGTPIATVDEVIATGRSAFPEQHLRFVMYPGQLQGEDHFATFSYSTDQFFSRIPCVALMNAYSGELVRTVDLPWYITMIYVAVPLHFGDYGGLPLRVVYAFFGLSAGALSISGFAMYFLRRRKRGNA